jgi:predicted transcriptional regulator
MNEVGDFIAFSIAPQWVQMILEGRKAVELRRRGPGVEHIGATALIYATRPWSAVVATGLIRNIRMKPPKALWMELGEQTGCTWAEFSDYFVGVSRGAAIELGKIHRIKELPLHRLKEEFGWRPPISWCRVSRTSKLASSLGT